MADWDDLEDELDEWEDLGIEATFWWRDDDADEPSDELDRLIAAADGEPLAIAVVPAPNGGVPLDGRLAERLAAEDAAGVTVLQHGYQHQNHEVPGGRKSEFGFGESEPREARIVLGELQWGKNHLATVFGERFLPVLVPPWNRIGNQTRNSLTWLGYRGLSTSKARPRLHAVPGVLWSNVHCDPVDWRGDRGFIGEEDALESVLDHLIARREEELVEEEATGLLTHHKVMDDACWDFCEKLRDFIRQHAASRFVSAHDVFPAAPRAVRRWRVIRHRYPPASLLADYGRAGIGFAATSLPLLFLPADAAIVPVLGALALLFAGFAGRTALKQGMAIEMTQEGIAATGAWPADIRWAALDHLNLAYYSTRRDRRNGWMQLTLGAENRRLRVDSTLGGFQEVVAPLRRRRGHERPYP